MGYIEHVRHANHHDLSGFVPFWIETSIVGYLRPRLRDRLADFPDVFRVESQGVEILAADMASRTESLESIVPTLVGDGFIAGTVGEPYAVVAELNGPPLMAIDRGAVEAFGTIATGFHLNGITGDDMWIARRSRTKMTFPGQLDNMVAGGWPMGLSPEENLVKECGEEAGISAEVALQAKPVGLMTYVMEVPGGLRRHAMSLYDIELPAGFTPRVIDGEVESFHLYPIDEVARIVRETDEFKYNSALAVIDYLVRTSRIRVDVPGYVEILAGMKSPLTAGTVVR